VPAAYTVDALRAFGERRLLLRSGDGTTFEGRIVQERLSDFAAVVLFAVDGEAGDPLVVPLESIQTIEER